EGYALVLGECRGAWSLCRPVGPSGCPRGRRLHRTRRWIQATAGLVPLPLLALLGLTMPGQPLYGRLDRVAVAVEPHQQLLEVLKRGQEALHSYLALSRFLPGS